MNKYIYSITDVDSLKTVYKTIIAKDIESAKDKIISKYFNEYEWDVSDVWKDFVIDAAKDYGTIIGDPKDIESF